MDRSGDRAVRYRSILARRRKLKRPGMRPEPTAAPALPSSVFIVWHRYRDDPHWYRCGFAFDAAEAERQAKVAKVATMSDDVKVKRYDDPDPESRTQT